VKNDFLGALRPPKKHFQKPQLQPLLWWQAGNAEQLHFFLHFAFHPERGMIDVAVRDLESRKPWKKELQGLCLVGFAFLNG
jgi:hypothetical protein